MSEIDVYRLSCRADSSVVVRTSLDYFQTHFIGKPMAKGWSPPELRIDNISKKPKDFISFATSAPTISEQAKTVLEPLISNYCEFLPLLEFKKIKYYSINVTNVVDCLDVEKSGLLRSKATGRILMISSFQFVSSKIPSVPIFTIEPPTHIFVTNEFVECVRENLLSNAVFSDPGVDPLWYLSRGIDVNIVPYLRM